MTAARMRPQQQQKEFVGRKKILVVEEPQGYADIYCDNSGGTGVQNKMAKQLPTFVWRYTTKGHLKVLYESEQAAGGKDV